MYKPHLLLLLSVIVSSLRLQEVDLPCLYLNTLLSSNLLLPLWTANAVVPLVLDVEMFMNPEGPLATTLMTIGIHQVMMMMVHQLWLNWKFS